MKNSSFLLVFLLGVGVAVNTAAGVDTQQEEKPLAPLSAAEWDARLATHLLDRAGFGGSPDQIAELAAMSPQQAVTRLIIVHICAFPGLFWS